jgi:hypothetical protein
MIPVILNAFYVCVKPGRFHLYLIFLHESIIRKRRLAMVFRGDTTFPSAADAIDVTVFVSSGDGCPQYSAVYRSGIALVLIPVFAMSFMQACRLIEGAESHAANADFRLLLTVAALPDNTGCNLRYFTDIALWIATLPGENGWEMVLTAQDKIDPKMLDTQELLTGTLWGMVAMLPVLMLTGMPPLMMWKNLP